MSDNTEGDAAQKSDAPAPSPNTAPVEAVVRTKYPVASDQELKRAGLGCVAITIVAGALLYVGLGMVFAHLRSLTSTGSEHYEPPVDGALVWTDDFRSALIDAEAHRRPALIHFHSPAVRDSAAMFEGTYANSQVAEFLAQTSLCKVDITSEDGRQIADYFDVEQAPHVVYLGPNGERLRPDSRGFVDADQMAVYLSEAITNLRDDRFLQSDGAE